MPGSWERALVVGASSGIGEAVARELGQRGVRVAVVARRADRLERLCEDINGNSGELRALAFPHDVRDWRAAGALFQEITTALGGLDLVVYAAGIMPGVGPHDYSTSTDVATIETNFTGAVAWLDEAAHRFGIAGCGTIVGISSVAGDRGRRGNPVYGASKAALNTYLESLRTRLARAGVSVVTIKPGYVRTGLLEASGRTGPIPVISPEEAAHAILDAAANRRRVVYVPSWWRLVMLAVRAIPAVLFERLSF